MDIGGEFVGAGVGQALGREPTRQELIARERRPTPDVCPAGAATFRSIEERAKFDRRDGVGEAMVHKKHHDGFDQPASDDHSEELGKYPLRMDEIRNDEARVAKSGRQMGGGKQVGMIHRLAGRAGAHVARDDPVVMKLDRDECSEDHGLLKELKERRHYEGGRREATSGI